MGDNISRPEDALAKLFSAVYGRLLYCDGLIKDQSECKSLKERTDVTVIKILHSISSAYLIG